MQWMAVIEFSHAYYCLENAFSRITFKRYRLFSGILMTNTRKHNKINASVTNPILQHLNGKQGFEKGGLIKNNYDF